MANNTKPKTKGKTKKYYPKEKTLKALTKKVNKLTKEVQGEKKVLQQGSNAPCGAINGTSQGLLLDGPLALSSAGSGVQNRIGNRIKLLSMQVKGLVAQQASCVSNRKVRIMIVENIDHNLVAPAVTAAGLNMNLFDNDGRTGSITTESYRNFVNTNNWKIWGQTFVYLDADSIANQTTEKTFNFYIKFGKNGLNQNYNAVASALEKGALYLIALCDNGDTSANTGVRVYYDIRTIFVDN